MHIFEANGKNLIYDNRSNCLVQVNLPEPCDLRELPPEARDEFTALKDHRILNEEPAPALDIDEYIAHSFSHRRRNIHFFTTNRCNLNCKYCYQSPNTDRNLDADKSLGDAVIEMLQESGRPSVTINFFGGEPLLNFAVLKYVTEKARAVFDLQKREVRFSITTNGTLLDENEEIIDLLVAHGFAVMVSLDGREEDNVHRMGPALYRKLVRNIQDLLDKQKANKRHPLIIRPTLTNLNYEESNRIADYLKDLFPGARIGIGSTWGKSFLKGNLDINFISDEESLKDIDNLKSVFHKVLGGDSITYNEKAVLESYFKLAQKLTIKSNGTYAPNLCGVCRNSLAVGPEGDCYPCHRYYGMQTFKLGNVGFDGGFDKEKTYQYYYKVFESRIKHCSTCWANRLCLGICIWTVSDDDGNIHDYPEEECDMIRRSFEHLLTAYSLLQQHFSPEEISRVHRTFSFS